MADAASANLQIRRPKSMFILRAMWKKAVIRRKKDADRIAFYVCKKTAAVKCKPSHAAAFVFSTAKCNTKIFSILPSQRNTNTNYSYHLR